MNSYASMTSRERVRRALTFATPDRTPRDLWRLEGVAMFRKPELDDLLHQFAPDIAAPDFRYGKGRSSGVKYQVGTHSDEWGCVFHAGEPGVKGEVKEPLLADWETFKRLTPPDDFLSDADLSRVNQSCAESDRFMLAHVSLRPFERMQFLRGTENLLMDLAWGKSEVLQLRDMLHDFYMQELALWKDTAVDGIFFMDDWGSQKNLLISPRMWREVFKPLYADYCRAIHAMGKFVFFHSDGYILPILGDLIEVGIDALNSQLFCMNIEEIGNLYKGKITFWGEIDRQRILPFGRPEDVTDAVRRVRRALEDASGGMIAQCEWGIHDPVENIRRVFEAWEEPIETLAH